MIAPLSRADGAFNLKELFEKSLRKYQHRTAVIFDEIHLSYGVLDQQSNALANALVAKYEGKEEEKRVAILMENRPEYVISELAVTKAGMTKVLLNSMLERDEIEYILNDSRANILICGPDFVEIISQLASSLEHLETVVCVNDDVEDQPNRFVALDEFYRGYTEDVPPDVDVSPDDVVFHAYTGGTTGNPKGVLHTHRSRAMLYYSALAELDISEDDRLLFTTPLPHSAGSFFRSSLLIGATSVVRSGFDMDQILNDIEQHRITWTFMVPTMIYRLLDHPEIESRDLSTLETVVYGAAPMTPARLTEGLDRLGPIFKQFYGQTEIPNLITTLGKEEHKTAIRHDEEERLSSAGQPCLMADVKIVDPDTGEPQTPGSPGEILATAPYVMEEYFERPEMTRETLAGKWVRTGDIGKQDEQGYVTLLDRMSDVVVTGGMNVYTNEVEDVLADHPAVRDVVVIGVPDDDWGEAVKALVIPKDGHSVDEASVISYADERLSRYKKPKSVDFLESFPKTPYSKVDKKELRDAYWEGAERQIN
ncbi:AMP-binding protein [Halegenticoccus tardaugens]|uniref:AMP-binding protein n=1 Tax=Halegenticoccus tardaugens TaxID=2071624 RepID=UPI00100BBCF4|nr:AMP-binding protein [Halegenticoccus tardaugens]